MAFRRSITARAKLLYQQQRVALPFSHIHRDDEDHETLPHFNSTNKNPKAPFSFQHRLFGTGNMFGNFRGSRNLFEERRFVVPVACMQLFGRNMSSMGEGQAENINMMTDVAEVLGDKAVEVASQVGPVANEVAIAASDSFFPIAALQYLINYVHIYTGFNWWASIVLTTILVHLIQLPLTINLLKSTSRTRFFLLRPRLEEIKQDMQNRGMSPAAVAEGQARMKELFKEYGVTRLKRSLIVYPVVFCFLLAISNMVEHVASFKEGGTLWFTDLTTPDTMYIFPVMALMYSIRVETVESTAPQVLEGGNPAAIKNVLRVVAVLAAALAAIFPNAIFCYLITTNLFSLTCRLVLNKPEVKKMLGIPILPVEPVSTDQKPGISFIEEALKKYAAAQQQQQQSLSSPPPSESSSSSSKPTNRRISSSSVISQRLTSLEREVKVLKKSKKR